MKWTTTKVMGTAEMFLRGRLQTLAQATIKLQRPFVCLSVCTPPFFRHDRRTATKFGTHMRVDMGLILSQKNVTHPTPGGFLGDQKIKSLGNVMNCQKIQKKKTRWGWKF